MADDATSLIWLATAAATLRFAAPLLLAALGELVCEKAGVVNLGVEGMVAVGAIVAAVMAVIAAPITGWAAPLVGMGCAVGVGATMGLLLALLVVLRQTDQIVTGLAFNLAGMGIAGGLLSLLEGRLTLGGVGFEPLMTAAQAQAIPVFGPLLLTQTSAFYAVLLLLPITHLWLYRTRSGLVLRCCGENPSAIDAAGYSVVRTRLLACVFAGACAGGAGGFLSLAATHTYVDRMTASYGFIALALVIFGRWHPLWVALATLLFGFLKALPLTLQTSQTVLQSWLGSFDIAVVYPLFDMLPYALTLLLLAAVAARIGAPVSLGEPFRR